ncbi:bifunctional hydroxymethylpyrimidine kinase/phosphomethylpyrimidine kinase [Aquamicrobium sp. LC103]|uniref:bifunctional hydroxymethylpyrimidine kinase/phosphomethylpyrimidine kinase n=1 Tax=Aquamicrobium sp. LC103 TaxID=1120658 RepID=UPI00069BA375|nr:bifunctional hydroxymethylpyrimidine kinase/phosphomethylpyrimidine kinase [Aquamicrobium sp. LC103]TKT69545.1 hydroxymethylpyrimidine/phosphomethylpyrimidine kinase [Aquamicrobium sp. LC103]
MIANVLTIAGTDPSGGAGIQADIKTFSALGAYAASVITAVVAQNTQGVRSFVALEPKWTLAEMRACVAALHRLGPQWVLLKGGHLEGSEESTDLLHDGQRFIELSAPRIATKNDHGTGCTLSAAIAALLPSTPVEDSVRTAKGYMHGALAVSGELDVGHGHGPLHHFYRLWGRGSDEGDRIGSARSPKRALLSPIVWPR